ncbi:3-isopropylmalate dehydratase small subunit [Jannaschia sp. CCS1]|uniref:3-isopropylmalate dehydratase small subunit n=1 Tax=Jannaschia sp. (strain CCS1) TaxID=290400 RepID=UPI000053DB6B|nr:3-isopropylmalate dehydratase small subunit [Jannaschia sp. CCS1]ABD56677.1 3-isopropylmalate dehydratase, small subunit [Jannaschia sp. CCS1]
MKGWTILEGRATALDRDSVDTDQLIPARFMSTPRREGYGRFLLHDLRFDAGGKEVLKVEQGAKILISRRNFGSGSSREAAVYALVDFGIRAVLAPSFGDIFASNAVNNGLLPARITASDCDALIADMAGEGAEGRIDLAQSTARIGTRDIAFDLDPAWREKLINGWDDIDLTGQHAEAIAAFRDTHMRHRPWALPRGAARADTETTETTR